MVVAKSFSKFRSSRVSLSCQSCPLQPRRLLCPITPFCLPYGVSAVFKRHSHGALWQLVSTAPIMPSKILPSQKSSRRRLNTGSVSNSRQEATPASAEVGPSPSSNPSVDLRGDAESAEVSSSLSGQTIMDTHGSVVPSQSSLVEPRIKKRRDRSPSETSDCRADTSRRNPSSDRGNSLTDRGNPSTFRGNSSNNSRGNPSDQESPVDFLDSTFIASADHSMS